MALKSLRSVIRANVCRAGKGKPALAFDCKRLHGIDFGPICVKFGVLHSTASLCSSIYLSAVGVKVGVLHSIASVYRAQLSSKSTPTRNIDLLFA